MASGFEISGNRFSQSIGKPFGNPKRGQIEAEAPPSFLAKMATLWKEQGRSRGLLLHGDTLAETEQWAEKHSSEVGEDERDFLAECLQARAYTAQEKKAQHFICAVTALGLLMAAIIWHGSQQVRQELEHVGAALTTVEKELEREQVAQATAQARIRALYDGQGQLLARTNQSRQALRRTQIDAHLANARALGAEARLLLDDDREGAILLALEAMQAAAHVIESPEMVAASARTVYQALGHTQWDMEPVLLDTAATLPVWIANDGKALIATDQGSEVYDSLSGRRLHTLPLDGLTGAWWAPDSDKLLLLDHQRQGHVWDMRKGSEVAFLNCPERIAAAWWHPSTEQIVGRNRQGDIVAWDSTTGEEMWRRTLETQHIVAAEWLDAGQQVGMLTEEHVMIVLDSASGESVARLGNCYPSLQNKPVGYAKIGHTIDGEPLLYLLPGDALVQVACSQLERNLTPTEWSRYMEPDMPYHCTCDNLPPGT